MDFDDLIFTDSALEHGYSKEDAIKAWDNRLGDIVGWPDEEYHIYVGPSREGNPIVVIVNTDHQVVYHMYRYEKRYRRVLWSEYRGI